MDTITVTLNKYFLNLKKEGDAERYEAIKEIAKGLGHKLFDSIGGQRYHEITAYFNKLPNVQTIETKHLFNNQYDTVEGFRIFDWEEEICVNNRNIKEGYYLTGDLDKLKEAKENQLCCGYCGHRYDKRETELKFCNACLDSEYLEEKNLPLLLLQPVSSEGERHKAITENVTAEIHAAWDAAKPKMIERMELARRKRCNDKATRLESDLEKKIEEVRILTTLLRHGISTDNLIYYSHTNKWTFGWSKKLVESERAAIIEQLKTLDDFLLPDLWIESIDWQMERDSKGFPVASRDFGTTRQYNLQTIKQ